MMLGILSSMFTALFVTRVIFDFLLNKRILKDHLFMLRIIHNAKVNWMKARPVFLTVSSILIIGGLIVFFTRNDVKDNKYDIEFTGGTSVQVVFKPGVNYTQQDVQNMIRDKLPAANVYSVGDTGKQFEITTTETNKLNVAVSSPQLNGQTADQVKKAIEKAQKDFTGELTTLIVTQDSSGAGKFNISTSQMNQSLVKEVLAKAFPDAQISQPQVDEFVNNAILDTFAGKLEMQENLQPTITSEEKITAEMIEANPELSNFLGGIKLTCEIKRPDTVKDIKRRIADLQFKPDTRDLEQYDYEILNSKSYSDYECG